MTTSSNYKDLSQFSTGGSRSEKPQDNIMYKNRPANLAGIKGNNCYAANPFDDVMNENNISGILSTSGIGLWSFDISFRQLHLCTTAMRLIGLEYREVYNLRALVNILRGSEFITLISTARAACKNGVSFEKVIVLNTCTDCTERWLKITGSLFSENHRVIKMMGTVTDVTREKTEEIWKKDLMTFLSQQPAPGFDPKFSYR